MEQIRERNMKKLLSTAAALSLLASSTWADTVAVITPYLSQPGTQAYVEGFEAAAAENGRAERALWRRPPEAEHGNDGAV